MRVLVVKHDHASPEGFVGDAFTSLGYDVSSFTVVPFERRGDPNIAVAFPDPRDYDAIVALGAAWSVYDEKTIGNWIGNEIAFTRSAVASGVPVLGICFGGQMLATALGGEVSRAPEPEIGWHEVSGAAAVAGPWFQWHYDRYSVPPAARALARTPRANQAFVQGRSLGLQFHPELNADVLQAWLDNGGASELAAHGADASELMARTRELQSAAALRTRSLITWFTRNVANAEVNATILTSS